MRRIVFAPSFDREVEDIGVDVEEGFGEAARYEFITDLMATCSLLASFPGMATDRHGYDISLVGFVFQLNWVFFDHDPVEVRFLHIVDSRRDKGSIPF
jgi:plasmid stabilization system protein ParE